MSVIHGGSGLIAATCDSQSIPHWQLPLEKKGELLLGIPLLVLKLKKIKPDLLILHGQWAGPIGALSAKIAGISRIIYVTQWPSLYTDWGLFRIIRNYFCERIPCKLANYVVAISKGNYYQYLVRRLADERKLVMINNSINLESTPDANDAKSIRERFGWGNELCHVVSVGRLSDQKRVDWLLASWKIVISQTKKAKLWIVGSGPEEQSLRQLAKNLDLEESCTFLGAQPNGSHFIAAADIVAMTSIYEGHANVPLEALACGKPIVANDVDGVNDTIENGKDGFLTPPCDMHSFSQKLLDLIQDPELRLRMGSAGLQSIKRFSQAKIMEQYSSLALKALSEHRN